MFTWFKRKQSGINFDVCICNVLTFSDAYIAKERTKAQAEFFGQSFPSYAKSKSDTEKALARMLEWFVFDRPLPKYKKTPAELFIETNQGRWDEATRRVYADLLDNVYGFFEIMEVKVGEALTLRNLADGRRYAVRERKATYEVRPGGCLSGRIFPFEGAYLLSGVMDLWYEIIESLVIAEVASPSTRHRPGLQKLLQAARERQFDVLVSWEFGCLSKSQADLQYIFRIFAEEGIVYETVQNF